MAAPPTTPRPAAPIAAMFDAIAGRYDLLNRLMSAGQDGRWRRAAVAALTDLPAGPLLDIGSGTGDFAIELGRRQPERLRLALDVSAGMLAIARQKLAADRLAAPVLADVTALPLADDSIAGAVTGFTLRNVPELATALGEARRVLQPGAPFACLEITRPRAGVLAALFGFYFGRVVPLIGEALTRRTGAYRYLPASVNRFLTGDELRDQFVAAGFERVRVRRFWPGPVTLHVGRKPAGAARGG